MFSNKTKRELNNCSKIMKIAVIYNWCSHTYLKSGQPLQFSFVMEIGGGGRMLHCIIICSHIVLYTCLHDTMEESDQPYKFLRIFSFPNDLPQAVKIDFIKILGQTEEYQKESPGSTLDISLDARGWQTPCPLCPYLFESGVMDWRQRPTTWLMILLRMIEAIVACSFVFLYLVDMHNRWVVENLVDARFEGRRRELSCLLYQQRLVVLQLAFPTRIIGTNVLSSDIPSGLT